MLSYLSPVDKKQKKLSFPLPLFYLSNEVLVEVIQFLKPWNSLG